jgi:hypothetical protein
MPVLFPNAKGELSPEWDKIPQRLVFNRPLKEVVFRIRSTDDWYPCFPNNTVEVSLHKDGAGAYRIAIWGDDDYGMERDFGSEEEMRSVAAALPIPITKFWLQQNLFVQA